ncbi:sensor domain-containing diguanylate cyclase [Bacillus salinus]|uniref:sensor domain-containing diguanylate cyclase n=1 Tax=Bacillus sp. HMF5848 TaxID=2495421 RepID=UPI00163974CA|nr:sensor domain-containing diguanylate cyclase [Bacillus sp. HMF5848]
MLQKERIANVFIIAMIVTLSILNNVLLSSNILIHLILVLLIFVVLWKLSMQNKQLHLDLQSLSTENQQLHLDVQSLTAKKKQLHQDTQRLSAENQHLHLEVERLSAENQQLQHKSFELEEAFNSSFGGIFIYDLRTHKLTLSAGFEQIYGHSVQELSKDQQLFYDLIHPQDLEEYTDNTSNLLLGEPIQSEFRISHPQYGTRWILKIAKPIKNDADEVIKISGQIIDITKQKELEIELKQLAYYDEITDLPNRKLLNRHIEKALARSKRHNHNFTIMFIDIDDFKKVNDTQGHDAGDILLKKIARRLIECIREEDLIARIGGDEFVLVFEETCKTDIEVIAQRILDYVALPYNINGEEAKISLSIGISMYPDDGENKETLIIHADKAMYSAKNNGKNNFKIYSSDLDDMELKKEGIVTKLLNKIQTMSS